MTRGRSSWLRSTALFMTGVLVGAFSSVQIAKNITGSEFVFDPNSEQHVPTTDPTGLPTGTDPELPTTPGRPGAPTGSLPAPDPTLECKAGRNGGETDRGVTAGTIKLATTNVQSGSGASFLGEVRFGMEAVRNRVNRLGGICGRQIEITYVDDGWDPARGQNAIRNFINDDIFAIAVGPSSEGIQQAIKSGDVDKAGIPIVGADGMVINQYQSPWVWPVAVATVSSARIMGENAWRRGARSFSIIFDKDYKFGQEAALAFNNWVARKTGSDIPGFNAEYRCRRSFCGIEQGASSYATEVQQFEPGDFVAMFLEPGTALTWMSAAGAPKPSQVKYGIGGAQPMFTRGFAESCQSACNGMWIWSGYRPPIDPYGNTKAVRTFSAELRQTKPNADDSNAFTEGGYLGMEVLVEALRRVGPDLTRERLRATLDSMTIATGLSIQPKLSWRPGNHFANTTMRAFQIRYSTTFGGWVARDEQRDLEPERGIG